MSETTKVRIGLSSTRELELDMDDSSDVAKALKAAMDGDDAVLWLTDSKGHRHGIILDKLAFVEIEKAAKREVGFS
jgi:Protein of unknown function (DUF3107)